LAVIEPGRRVVTALSIPLFAFFTVITVLLLATGLRRLMGMTLSPLRTLIAALIALFSASPIITAMAGTALSSKNPGVLPGLWFVILGVVIAMLVGMIFLVISEALVPSGSLPGPLYALRGTRRLAGRTRRYSQISRVLTRHGLLPYLRGGRRAELATTEGRARLARSLRLALEDGGVTFIKLGQLLSTRRDLLPPEFIAELSRLQDDAPTVPWPDIKAVLEESLGGPVSEKFAPLRRRADRGGVHRPGAYRDAAVRRAGSRQGAPAGCRRARRLRPGHRAAAGEQAGAQHPLGPFGRRGRPGPGVR
jgi:ubiquinone biosynthesis protein